MTELPAGPRRAMVLRSFAVQGSWNYETLIGTGFAYVLLPALRHQAGDDTASLRAAVSRHAELFNSHPYLVTVAAGAVARLELDGANPELVTRFKDALRGPLGSLGDRLFWLAWRPGWSLVALTLLLLGAPWWVAVAAFLVGYDSLHLWVRTWGLAAGLSSGLEVGAVLRASSLERWANRASSGAATLAGFATVLAASQVTTGSAPDLWVAASAAGAGFLLDGWTRRIAWGILAVGWTAGIAGIFAAFG